MPATEVIEVRGMSCGGCERSVRLALEAVPGVESAAADLVAEEAVVTYDPGLADVDAMLAAIRAVGFLGVVPPADELRIP